MKVAIVKYNAGNIYSVTNALRRLGVEPMLTDSAEELLTADRVLFPGQGEARQAMDYLRSHSLDRVICDLRQPVLGICIGQQLMCRHSEEGDTDCLGIFPVDVKRFRSVRHEDKVPHMGWNQIRWNHYPALDSRPSRPAQKDARHFENPAPKGEEQEARKEEPFVYFVHSYYVPICEYTAATCDYIQPFSAALHKDNYYATQFHPEKSGAAGEKILRGFLELKR